jgi:leader peptidase (prepilin peptidase) / N-methyltransferase
MVLYAILGAVVGSFLNVCIDRLPLRQSLAQPPSHCAACGRRLTAAELIPIFSYLALAGRCRTCGAAIPKRVLMVEALTAGLFAWLWAWNSTPLPLAVATLYTCILVIIFFIDLEHRLILNRVIYPAMILAAGLAVLRSLPGDPLGLSPVAPTWGLALIGGGLGFLAIYLPAWLSKGGMGAGDVKLGAFAGLAVGFPAILAGLFWGFFAGGLLAAFLLVTKIRGRRDAIPYGPFLSAGAWIALLYGRQMMAWYLGRF